jgi:hypothetical protein
MNTRDLVFASLALGALLCSAHFATAQTFPSDKPHTYFSPDLFYTVEIPAGWDYRHEEGSNEITIYKDDASVSVAVPAIEETDTVQDFLDVNKTMLKSQCPSAEVRAQGKATVAGVDGEYLSMFCPGPRLPTLVRISASIQFKHFFVFNVTAPSEQWVSLQPIMSRMAQTYRAGDGLPEGREPRKRAPPR